MEQSDGSFWTAVETLVASSKLVIDRPKGSHHPRFPTIEYPLDYGYLENTRSMDGGGIDIWVGSIPSRKVVGIMCTIDLAKKDSEMKILLGCTEEDMEKANWFHNCSEQMKGLLITRP